jgi:hypothetical protein
LDRNGEACVFSSSEDFLLGLVQKFVSGRRADVMGSGGKLSAVGKLSTKERSTSGFDERIYRTNHYYVHQNFSAVTNLSRIMSKFGHNA